MTYYDHVGQSHIIKIWLTCQVDEMGHMIRDKGIGNSIRYLKRVTLSGIKELVITSGI